MADNETQIRTEATVEIKNKASNVAKNVAKGFDTIAESAKTATSNLALLEAKLDEINRLEKESKLTESQAGAARGQIYSSIKSEAKAHEENAKAINSEAASLKRLAKAEQTRADAYKKNTDFKTSAEGISERQKKRDLARDIENGKNYRQDKKTKVKMAEIEEKAANRELREQNRKDRIRNSRRGANSTLGNLLVSAENKVRDRGYLGRATGAVLGITAAGLTRGPWGILTETLKQTGSALMDFRDSVLEAYGSVEKIKTQMGVVFGTKTQADTVFQNLSDYAVKSPFGIESVSEFAVLLKQSGVYGSDLLDTLKMIGDTAGGDNEKMKRIANNYAQIVAVGKASMLDMRQFAYAGIPIYKEVADYLKVSQSELRNMISDGKVSAEVIEKVFEKMTSKGGVFNEATEKGALTLSARRQNLEDVKTMAKAQLGEWRMNRGNPDGLGGSESQLIDMQEGFYKSLETWGKNSNLIKNVEQLATVESRYKELESYEEFVKKSDLPENQKKELLKAIGLEKIRASSFYNPDNQIKINALVQETFEQQTKAYNESQEIQKSINQKLEDMGKSLEEFNKTLIKNNLNEFTPSSFFLALGTQDLGKTTEAIKEFDDFINNAAKYAGNGSEDIITIGNAIKKEMLSLFSLISRINEIGTPAPTKLKSTYETQFAAGSSAITSTITLLNDNILKAQKSANGSQTIMGKINEIVKNTPEAREKEEEEKLKRLSDQITNAKKIQELIDGLSSGKISQKDLSLRQNVDLETNWANVDTGYYGENAFDFVTGMDENATFKSDQAKKNFIDLTKDAKEVTKIVKANTDDKELLDKVQDLSDVITYGKMDMPVSVKNFFERYRAVAEYLKNKQKQNLSVEEKEKYADLQTIIASAFRRNDYTTSGIADTDQSVLDSAKASGINSIDLEPLWKRIIASVTGLDINMMKGMGSKQIFEDQLAPTFSRQLVSSAIASIYKNGGALGSNKNDLNYAYSLLSFDGFKTLGSGDKGGNLATVKTIASEKVKNSKSKSTAINSSSPPEKVAQIGWMQTEKNILNAAKSGKLNSGTLQLLKQTVDSRTDVLAKLVQASFEQQENGEYVKGQDFNNAFVNAFSGLKIGEDETLKATVNGKEEILTFDRETKQFKKASGGFIEATDKVIYSLENLSQFIQKYGKKIASVSHKLKTVAISQGAYEENQTEFKNSFVNTQASISAMEYINAHPELANVDGLYEYVKSIIAKRLFNEIESGKEIKSLDDAKGLIPKDVLKYGTDKEQVDLPTSYAKTKKDLQANNTKTAFSDEYANKLLSGGLSESPFRAGIRNVLGITGTNTYREQKAMDALGFSGNWKDISSDFGKSRLKNLTETSPENMNLLQKKEMQALRDKFGEEGQSDKDLLSSIEGDTSKLEQASSILRDMDASFLDMTKLVEELGNGVKNIAINFASSAITDTTKQIGENLAAGNDALEGCGKRMKELGTAAMSNLSSLFVQAGLSIIAAKPHMWAVGAALISAGGMAGIITGMMSGTDDDNSDEDEAAKLRSIKEDLSDLLEQARNDAIYYENELRHRNALSTGERLSGSTRTSSVHDALISSNGNIITTDPKDYLIATKHPEELAGGAGSYSPKISFNVVNKSSGQVSSSYNMSKDSDGNINIEAMIEDKIVEMISSSKTDDAFMAREARKNGRSVVA